MTGIRDLLSRITIPLHRVRAVWRDGTLIWERAVPPVPTEAAR